MTDIVDKIQGYSAFFSTLVSSIPRELIQEPESEEEAEEQSEDEGKKDKKQQVPNKKQKGPGNNAPYVKMATSLSDLHAKMREKLVEMQARRGDGKRKLRKEKAVVRTNTKREATEIEGLKPSEDDLTVKKRRKDSKNKEGEDEGEHDAAVQASADVEEIMSNARAKPKELGSVVAIPSLKELDRERKFEGTSKKQKLRELLKETEKKEKMLERLKGTEEGERMQSEMKWDKAFKQAQGEVVKDDPKLIRKTLKREHAKKVKSAKQWAERKEKSEGSKNSKIDKRMSNIKKYRGKRLGLEEEGGEKPKTGRRPPPSATKQSPTAPKQARPGFEGNRKGFGFHKRKEE